MFPKRSPFALVAFLAIALLSGSCAPAYAAEHAERAEHPESGGGGEEEGGKKGAKDDKDGVITGGRFKGDLIYVHIQPMVVPVINENGAEQIVTMLIDLQVKNFDAADTMHSNMPRVQDAILRTLYGGLGQGTLKKGHLVNIAKTKAKIHAAVELALGQDIIDDVLIQAVAQRML